LTGIVFLIVVIIALSSATRIKAIETVTGSVMYATTADAQVMGRRKTATGIVSEMPATTVLTLLTADKATETAMVSVIRATTA
jgi:hypothetical protein